MLKGQNKEGFWIDSLSIFPNHFKLDWWDVWKEVLISKLFGRKIGFQSLAPSGKRNVSAIRIMQPRPSAKTLARSMKKLKKILSAFEIESSDLVSFENERSLQFASLSWENEEESIAISWSNQSFWTAQFYGVEWILSESNELMILASRGIVVRAEQLSQKGWFVAFALEHNCWLISGASRRDRWYLAFALEQQELLVNFWGEPSGSLVCSVCARAWVW